MKEDHVKRYLTQTLMQGNPKDRDLLIARVRWPIYRMPGVMMNYMDS